MRSVSETAGAKRELNARISWHPMAPHFFLAPHFKNLNSGEIQHCRFRFFGVSGHSVPRVVTNFPGSDNVLLTGSVEKGSTSAELGRSPLCMNETLTTEEMIKAEQ